MSDFTVYYSANAEPVTVSTVADLDALLDRVAADPASQKAPPLVEIVTSDERQTLDIGLARPAYSVLLWHDDDADEAVVSVGTVAANEAVAFDFGGTWTNMPDECTIPVAVARLAVREFLATGQKPTGVGWQEPRYRD